MADDHSSPWQRTFERLKAFLPGQREPSLRDQIEDVIDEAEEEGDPPAADDLSPTERAMLRNLLHFGQRTAGDVAVPRGDIVAIPQSLGFAEMIEAVAESGHSRVPLYGDDLDDITGMVLMKDVFALMAAPDRPADARQAIPVRQPLFVPPSMGAVELLNRMRADQVHLAIVTDEYGGTDGLVTLEDLVEEIFDEIADEHDDAPVELLEPLECGVWRADARAPLDEVGERVDPRLAETDADIDTVGGLAFLLAGNVPAAGEILLHPSGWRIEITEADERRVVALRLHPPGSMTEGNEPCPE